MINDLEQFSVERLEGLIGDAETWSSVSIPSNQLAALARIALAAKSAKPIGSFHIYKQQVEATTDYVKDGEWPIDNGELLVYAAPQLNSLVIPDGWKLVPEEATLSMLTLLGMTGSFEFMQQKYKNMLAATPAPEEL